MPAKIVILDGHTTNPGDLDWASLAALGELQVYERTLLSEIPARAKDADILLTNKTPLDAETIAGLPALRYVAVLATGYNVVDGKALRSKDIPLSNVPGYGTASVAQHVFALLLDLTNSVSLHSAGVHREKWSLSRDFCYTEKPLVELSGLTFGVIGFGEIAQAVLRIAHGFGMHLAAHSRTEKDFDLPVRFVSREELAKNADVISLHCPLTDDTKNLVNENFLSLVKPTAYLLNTGRGALVNGSHLSKALRSGRLAGAGIDVLEKEPPDPNHPLFGAPNCVITPHIAWATRAARQRLIEKSAENVRAFLSGGPQNVVN